MQQQRNVIRIVEMVAVVALLWGHAALAQAVSKAQADAVVPTAAAGASAVPVNPDTVAQVISDSAHQAITQPVPAAQTPQAAEVSSAPEAIPATLPAAPGGTESPGTQADHGADGNNALPMLQKLLNQDAQAGGASQAAPVAKPANSGVAEPVWQGSLMLTDEKIQWIKEALKAHETNIPLEILMPELFPTLTQPIAVVPEGEQPEVQEAKPVEQKEVLQEAIPTEAPVFYLNSVLYIAPDQWTLWVNDKKMSYGDNKPPILPVKIISVVGQKVTFLWPDSKIKYIYPGWKSAFRTVSGTKYLSNQQNIVVDEDTGNVSFVLQPNQSFVSKDLSIHEGKLTASTLGGVDPVAGVTAPETGAAEDEATDDDVEETESEVQDTSGLGVLLKYQEQINMLRSTLDENKNTPAILTVPDTSVTPEVKAATSSEAVVKPAVKTTKATTATTATKSTKTTTATTTAKKTTTTPTTTTETKTTGTSTTQ